MTRRPTGAKERREAPQSGPRPPPAVLCEQTDIPPGLTLAAYRAQRSARRRGRRAR